MKSQSIESCENCGRPVGKLERMEVFDDHAVCADCLRRLIEQRNEQAARELQYESGASQVVDLREKYADMRPSPCPGCGSRGSAVRKAKGSLLVLILLFILGVLPGVLYLVFYHGYIMVCPACGMKRGDAT